MTDDRFGALANLGAAVAEAARADETLRQSVEAAREAGATWTDIGAQLGVTKQTAWEKYYREDGRSKLVRGRS